MATNPQARLDPREVLERCARKRVRLVSAGAIAEQADALFEVAKQRQDAWEQSEWLDVLASLDRCDLTVREWLALEDHNRRTS